jgi:hypothetical protein
MADLPRDWTVRAASLQARLRLADHVMRVRPGVPLRPSDQDAWEIDPTGADARWLSGGNETGGNLVDVWKSATFETHTPGLYKAGDTLRIDYIDDHGRIYLVRDPEGKIEAINSSDVFMTAPLK